MKYKEVEPGFNVSPQLPPDRLAELASRGFRSVICNRPDGEEPGQPSAETMRAAAEAAGLQFTAIPVVGGAIGDADVARMAAALAELPRPILAYCRSGARSAKLWELAQDKNPPAQYDVVIVGGGSAGIASAASLLRRRPGLSIAIIEPSDVHYYQPGWTLVGAGVFTPEVTRRATATVIPDGCTWIRESAASFEPESNAVRLADGTRVKYRILVAAPGLKLDWDAIPGLSETLGKNGVTSNYRYDLAPYTYKLACELSSGRALFTQPPMPIKCAGAPQKAMYLSCDLWRRAGKLGNIDVQFHTAGAVLFGVAAYVPALNDYVQRYGITLNLESRLTAVDGNARVATFEHKGPDGAVAHTEQPFDMLHAVPPQLAPDFIRSSALAGASGFVEVDDATLQHARYPNVFGLGDACSAPNAKTAAAARKQAPVVAENALAVLDGAPPIAVYDGYGSCPLTVERGRIVLAEFGYGGKLLPSFPKWLIDGTRPSRAAWFLKDRILPALYWRGMLKGREWLAKPAHKPLVPSD
ncbi:TIGR01244 family sulfur transferase [Emcibacter sp. SYSU 3D8]|uniref:TIGR01244 family sulfur transferase n=1 Tax=Emcibacter sp. SYSU 3D8 TaxID=3133969 RepID=UPI0031FEDE86